MTGNSIPWSRCSGLLGQMVAMTGFPVLHCIMRMQLYMRMCNKLFIVYSGDNK